MRITITIIAFIASMFGSVALAAELVHQFNSPAFNGVGYSSHVLTIEQLETQRKQKLKDEATAAQAKIDLAAKNTNLSKFLVNVESRIYAQLSKQLADNLFAEGAGTSGTLKFEDTTIVWSKDTTAGTITLNIAAPTGHTEIIIPIASFAF